MIAQNYERLTAVGSGPTIRVDIDWPFLTNSELNVFIIKNSDGTVKYNRLNEISITIDPQKQYVTVENPFGEEATAYVCRVTPQTQTYDLVNGTALDAQALETALDKAIKILQELATAKVNGEQGYITSIDPFEIANAIARAEKLILFDEDGAPTLIAPDELPNYYKVKVSADDMTGDYLGSKLDINQFETTDPGGFESLSIKDGGLTIAKTNGLQASLDSKLNITDFEDEIVNYVKKDLTEYDNKIILDGSERMFIDDGSAKFTSVSAIINSIENNTVESIYPFTFTSGDLVADILTVNHTLGTINVNPAIYDNNNKLIIPDEIEVVDEDTIKLYFTANWDITGTWRGMLNSGTGILSQAGEVNTVTNVGTGAEFAKSKSGVDIPMRTLTSVDDSVTITQGTDTVDLSVDVDPITSIEGIPGLAADAQTPLQHDISSTTYHSANTKAQFAGLLTDVNYLLDDTDVVNDYTTITSNRPYSAARGNSIHSRVTRIGAPYDSGLVIEQVTTKTFSVNVTSIVLPRIVEDEVNDTKVITHTGLTMPNVDLTASGASGLDTGTLSPETWYYIWIISLGSNSLRAMVSLSPTSPTMPEYYTYARCVGAIRTNGSSDIPWFKQVGNELRYISPFWAKANAFTTDTWTLNNLALYVPPVNCTKALLAVNSQPYFGASGRADGYAGTYMSCYQPAGYETDFGGIMTSNSLCWKTFETPIGPNANWYYYAGSTTGNLYVLGFTFDNL